MFLSWIFWKHFGLMDAKSAELQMATIAHCYEHNCNFYINGNPRQIAANKISNLIEILYSEQLQTCFDYEPKSHLGLKFYLL